MSWFLLSRSGNSVIILSNSEIPPNELTVLAFSRMEGGTSLPPPVTSMAAGKFKLANNPLSCCVASLSLVISVLTISVFLRSYEAKA